MKTQPLSVPRMAMREILRRRTSFVSIVVAAGVAAGALLGAESCLRAYQIRSARILANKERELNERLKVLQDEMRKATLKLSFNLAILPGAQEIHEWHEKDYATTYMPEEYVHRLADSKIVTVRHFLPMLQQKVRWPERNDRTIILIGCKGEVPNLHKAPRAPLVQPVPDGAITLGYEIHNSLGIKVGETIRLMGRDFTVNKCHEERGSKDDITAWIPLKDAQALLHKPGLINAILALECVCVGDAVIDKIRVDIARYLPDTKVIEFGTQVLARGEAREKVRTEAVAAMERERRNQVGLLAGRERLAAWVLPAVLAACGVWIFLTAVVNARGRRAEVAILRAIGFRQAHILALFVVRHLVGGITGGSVGCVAGALFALRLGGALEVPPLGAEAILSWAWMGAAFALGPAIGVLGGWIPAFAASQQDPAQFLRGE